MRRILIVEDSPTQAERLLMTLEAEGLEAEAAADGDIALSRLAAGNFDMVISDIIMPGMSGYDLCRQIKSRQDLEPIPVILLTSRKDPMDIFRGLECGANNFFTKPYDPERLVERVRHIFFNRQLRSQGKVRMGVEISFFGKSFVIDTEKEQILDLLISTFEDAVQINADLEKSRDELAATKDKIEEYARLLEGRVRSSEELHRAIVEGATNGIIALDSDGNITSINPAAERMFGFTSDQVSGKCIDLLLHDPGRNGDERDMGASLTARVAEFAGSGPRDIEGRRADGSLFPMQLGINEVKTGTASLFVVVVDDLTVRKGIENELRASAERLARSNADLEQFAYAASHDLQEPLRSIGGMLQLLQSRYEGKIDQKADSFIDHAVNGAQRMQRLIDDLLTYSRAGRSNEVIPVDCSAVMDEVTQALRARIRETGAKVTWQDLPTIEANRTLTVQLFQNLISNAIKFHGDEVPEVKVSAHQNANGVWSFAVSDNGIGIDASFQDDIFKVFRRLHTRQAYEGTGIGLALCRRIVEHHSGRIWVESEPGRGSAFQFELGRAPQASAKEA